MGERGILRCSKCGKERPLGNITSKLVWGWPTHCGFTMEWITASQLRREQLVEPDPGGDCLDSLAYDAAFDAVQEAFGRQGGLNP